MAFGQAAARASDAIIDMDYVALAEELENLDVGNMINMLSSAGQIGPEFVRRKRILRRIDGSGQRT